MDNTLMVERTENANETFTLELIQEDEITPKGIKATYFIRKNGSYISGSLCFDEDVARKLYQQMKLNNGMFKTETVLLRDEIQKGGTND